MADTPAMKTARAVVEAHIEAYGMVPHPDRLKEAIAKVINWPHRDPPRVGVFEALEAWQDGEIGYLRAFELVGVGTIEELYAAARNSDVEIKF
jgi:hypothetical protein